MATRTLSPPSDQTAYQLELPNTEKSLLKKSMLLLRDYASRMDLSPEEIEKERGVILSEKTTRDSVDYRTWKESIKFALPKALITKRSPIGTEEVIKNAGRDRFLDFYKNYYTPERTTIVATGAVDPDNMASLIEEYFSDFQAGPTPGPDPDLGEVTTGRGIIAKLHTEEEASATEVTIDTLRPISKTPDTAKKTSRAIPTLPRQFDHQRPLERIVEKSRSSIYQWPRLRDGLPALCPFRGHLTQLPARTMGRRAANRRTGNPARP